MSSVDPDPTLDQLRSDLGAVDRELLKLVATRQRLASEIGRVKRERGIPTRNYRQETEVIERARAAAAEHGVSPETAAELMLLLIRSSLTVQEQDLVAATGEGSGKRVLVIGGGGKMGRWTARFLRSQGYTVEIADPGAQSTDGDEAIYTDWHQATLDHDIIVVAAPLAISNDILHELAERAPRGLVFDIGSLKSPLRSGLLACRDAGLTITSVHPMFGPDTELLTGRHVIFVDLGVAEANRQARELFASTMALQVAMDLDSHDRLIAYILGLSHALNIAFFTALAESGESAPKLAQLSSTTFDAQLGIAARVAEESPHLYFEIQHLNDYGTESLSALLYAVERIRSVVRAGDAAGFRALMERGRDYLRARRPADQRAP